MSNEDFIDYANHIPLIYSKIEHDINVWRFPYFFSQSRLGGRITGSNACTIIALKMAELIQTEGVTFELGGPLDRKVISALANSILEGNKIHAAEVVRRGLNHGRLNFTIPAAIQSCNRIFTELNYHSEKRPMWQTLEKHLTSAISYWEDKKHERRLKMSREPPADCVSVQHQKDLFCLLIGDERTMLIVYHPHPLQRLSLIDSHSHGQEGALIATAGIDQLHQFVQWITETLFSEMDAPQVLARVPGGGNGGLDKGYEISVILYSFNNENHHRKGYKKLAMSSKLEGGGKWLVTAKKAGEFGGNDKGVDNCKSTAVNPFCSKWILSPHGKGFPGKAFVRRPISITLPRSLGSKEQVRRFFRKKSILAIS